MFQHLLSKILSLGVAMLCCCALLLLEQNFLLAQAQGTVFFLPQIIKPRNKVASGSAIQTNPHNPHVFPEPCLLLANKGRSIRSSSSLLRPYLMRRSGGGGGGEYGMSPALPYPSKFVLLLRPSVQLIFLRDSKGGGGGGPGGESPGTFPKHHTHTVSDKPRG